jgi:2,3-bisphosphoglycerate-dependent phosphoglycerate mutase
MSILLIRHGETALNVARVLQPADTPLSARGVAQADALAQRLASMRLTAIVSSDLPRALATARAIAASTGAAVATSVLLRERNFGDWRGQPYDGMPVNPLTMLEAPPGGESAAVFARRVALAFAHIVRMRAVVGGTLAVVTHGLVIRALLASHGGLSDGATSTAAAAAPAHLGNTSLSVLEAQPPYRVTLLDCTRHLDAGSRDDANALSGG